MSSKETKNQNRLYLPVLVMLAATAVLSTVTTTGNYVFAQSDSEEDSNGNSDNVADNGNAGEGGNGAILNPIGWAVMMTTVRLQVREQTQMAQ